MTKDQPVLKSQTLIGEKVSLRPLTLSDKETFYQWATNSDATPFWYGELYGDNVPDRQKFFNDWTDEYFSDASIRYKRSFAIVINSENIEIGQINYQLDQDEDNNTVYDIDIIIAKDKHKGSGFGSEAISILDKYLSDTFPNVPFTIYALTSNSRAIKAYERAGFMQQKTFLDDKRNEWTKLVKSNINYR